MANPTQRRHLVRIAQMLNQYAADVEYAEVRPMRTRTLTETQLRTCLEHGIPVTMDCSESVTLMFRLAGLHDPNGLQYDGAGYTGTMLAHLEHFSDWNEVHAGTLIVFGKYPGTHVVMVTQSNGANPTVYSHGSYAKHAIWDLRTEEQYHQGEPITLLAIADL